MRTIPKLISWSALMPKSAAIDIASPLNGQAAMAEIRSRVPDLVILDIMLPDLDGFEICRQVKAFANGHAPPIILLTALDTDESRIKGKQCGANDYLTKPFDPDQLMQTMFRHVPDPRH